MSYPVRRRWDPFAQLQSIGAEFGRMFGSAMTRTGGLLPEVEVDRDDEGFTVTARLPGVAPEEVAVEVDSRELHIRARSVAETEQLTGVPEGEPGGPRPKADAGRSFDYRLSLGGDVDVEKVDATMDHGLLTVRLPRATRDGRRHVPVGPRAS